MDSEGRKNRKARPRRRRKRLIVLLIAAACVVVFLLSPLWPFVRSLAVMQISDRLNRQGSLEEELGLTVSIPGGGITSENDWYPFVMNFRADEAFSAYLGRPGTRLTVYYNFGSFDLTKGCSTVFDPDSPYYSAFYGAYLVRYPDGSAYGFSEEETGHPALMPEACADIASFDFFRLVLEDFGLTRENEVFTWENTGMTEGLTLDGHDDWVRLDARLTINGMAHASRGSKVQSYLQYGQPKKPVSPQEEFAPVEMTGIVCARYYPEWQTSVFYYCMAPDAEVCEECFSRILSVSSIRQTEQPEG